MKNKIFLLLGMMFILMISLVSSASDNLVTLYDCEDRITDQINTYDLSSSGSFSYSTDTYNGVGKSCDKGTTSYFYNNLLSGDYIDYGKNYSMAVEFKYDVVPGSGYGYIIASKIPSPEYRVIIGYMAGGFHMYHVDDNAGGEQNLIDIDDPQALEWYRLVITFDEVSRTHTIYFNNSVYTAIGGASGSGNPLNYFTLGHSSFGMDGKVDNIRIYDKTLSSDEAQEYLDYGEVNVMPPHNYTVTTTQEPDNLTSQKIGTLRINASITDTLDNVSDNNNSYALLDYNVVSVANSNCGYINLNDDSCNSFNEIINMTKINNSYFTYFTSEKNYLPAIYPFNQTWIEQQTMSEHTVKGTTFMRFNVHNMTTNQSHNVNVEYNIEPFSTLGDYSLLVLYCNSSYTTGSPDPSLNSYCSLIDEVLPTEEPNHCHNVESCHYVTRLNKNINWTSSGYFMFGTLGTATTDAWLVNYATNTSYNDLSFSFTTNNGVSWTATDHIGDIHLHQFDSSDNLNYNVTFYDGESFESTSENVIDYFDFVNAPPSTFVINNPATDSQYTINSTGVDVLFSWDATSDPEEDAIEYKVALSSNGFTPSMNLSPWLNESTLNYTYTFDSGSYSNGSYRAFVYAQDELGERITVPQTGVFYLCVNAWTTSNGLCIDGVRNVTYVDTNNCPDSYEQPSAYQENCTITDESKEEKFLIVFFFAIMLILTFLALNFKQIVLHLGIALSSVLFLILYVLQSTTMSETLIFISAISCIILALINLLVLFKK